MIVPLGFVVLVIVYFENCSRATSTSMAVILFFMFSILSFCPLVLKLEERASSLNPILSRC